MRYPAMASLKVLCLFALALLASASPVRAETSWRVDTDSSGQVWGVMHDNALTPPQGYLQLAAPHWSPYARTSQVYGAAYSEDADGRHWSAGKTQAGVGRFRIDETIRERADDFHIGFTVHAETALSLEGVFYRFSVPATIFGSGRCSLSGATPREVSLPAAGVKGSIVEQPADKVTFTDAEGNYVLTIDFGRPVRLFMKGGAGWPNTPCYDLLVQASSGNMAAGQEVALAMDLTISGHADRSPAHLRLDASRDLYRFDGVGGTYCYWPDTATTPYTLDHLHPAWARTQMSLDQWDAHKVDGKPPVVDWQAYTDKPGSDWGGWVLEGELSAAIQVSRHHVPSIISIWRVPPRMYEPGSRRAIARKAWPELAESVVAYLRWLKGNYGVEPALFSLNEADIGLMRDPADERDFFKVLGPMLVQAGLKTRLLAADTANPRGHEIDYARIIISDPVARRYCGGVSFHTWGGAEPDTYRAWGELARQYDLPLFVDEVGWTDGHTAITLRYGLEELRIYQQLLTYAQPQVLLEWEFGAGFPLLIPGKDGRLQPTFRYGFLAQYCTLTPRPATALGAESDRDQVTLTAFRGPGAGGGRAYALHIANYGADRPAVLEGLPVGARDIRAVQTSPSGYFQELGTLTPKDGALKLQLASSSLLTLTWQAPAGAAR